MPRGVVSHHRGAVMARASATGDYQLAAYVVPQAAPAAEEPGYRLPNGLVIAHCNKNETDYLYTEIFEKHSYIQHGIRMFEGMCVFDVGANIGMFTLYVKNACPGARIHAFEPIPPIHETLERLCDANSREIERAAGELHMKLRYGRTDDIITLGLHEYLMDFLDRISDLGNEISRHFLVPA